MTDQIAGEVAAGIQAASPFTSLLGLIPGVGPFVPLINGVLKAAGDAAVIVAASKPGASPEEIFLEVINHLTPGQPNSPVLAYVPTAV